MIVQGVQSPCKIRFLQIYFGIAGISATVYKEQIIGRKVERHPLNICAGKGKFCAIRKGCSIKRFRNTILGICVSEISWIAVECIVTIGNRETNSTALREAVIAAVTIACKGFLSPVYIDCGRISLHTRYRRCQIYSKSRVTWISNPEFVLCAHVTAVQWRSGILANQFNRIGLVCLVITWSIKLIKHIPALSIVLALIGYKIRNIITCRSCPRTDFYGWTHIKHIIRAYAALTWDNLHFGRESAVVWKRGSIFRSSVFIIGSWNFQLKWVWRKTSAGKYCSLQPDHAGII